MTLDSTRDAAPSAAAKTVPAATVRSMYGKPRVAICDTDYLMNQVRDAVNTPGAVPFPGVHQRVYASQHVFDELYGDDGHGIQRNGTSSAIKPAMHKRRSRRTSSR